MIKSNTYLASEGCRAGYGAGLLVLFILALSSCVTTITGGFSPDVSEEQAVKDYIQLAIAYYDIDDIVGAKRSINNAFEIDGNNSEVHSVLALIYQREGDMGLADEAFQRSINIDGSNSRARNNYAVFLFGREHFEDAFEQLQVVSADTNYDERAVAFENLGRSALRLNREGDAERAFERALQLNNNLYLSSVELAQIKFNKRELASARSVYNDFLMIREASNIPHTPRSLWIGIQIENEFPDSEILEGYSRLLTMLYQDSPEYQLYRKLLDDN
ncbi:MAG: type IV pilus biogenesis/stability protein PilW [Gammaproteobacteria bacterium]|nr:type IV pilus biogenesis/stability protein PilW [Gammaproteobacteria bacterium]